MIDLGMDMSAERIPIGDFPELYRSRHSGLRIKLNRNYTYYITESNTGRSTRTCKE